MKPELLALADQALDWIGRQPRRMEAEVYLYRGQDRGIELKEGRLESLQESSEEGMGLRLVDGGRIGFAYAGGLGLDVLPGLYGQALEQILHLPADEHRVLPRVLDAPAQDDGCAEISGTLFDPEMFARELQGMADKLREMESRALRKDKRIRKILHSGYGESSGETAIVSSTGIRVGSRDTSCSVGMAAVADDLSEVQVGSASCAARRAGALDFERTADEAAFRTLALLDSKKIPTKRRAVLFDPWIAGEFLEILAGALSADAVQRGKSLFRGRVGQGVASPLVTFIDDPRRHFGLASSCFDDEGVPTQRKIMVDRGVLKEFFYDAYTGSREGRASNGCAGRAGFKGIPGPTSSNFYLAPGTMSRERLISDTADGILVFELMGMHTADAVSGEFSIGISGVAVKNGEIANGIRGAMLSANILDVLAAIDAVADDLTFYSSLATPTFRAADLTVA